MITTSSDYQTIEKSGYLSQRGRNCSPDTKHDSPGLDVSISEQTGPHALELTCGNTVEAFSVNDPLIFAEGFYITSEGTSAGEQLAVITEEFSLKIKSRTLASSH